MEFHEKSNCTDTLLDLVCYEAMTKRLSPEMEDLLDRHLRCCPSCRRKMLDFHEILHRDPAHENFG